MGYRSDVYIKMNKNLKQEFLDKFLDDWKNIWRCSEDYEYYYVFIPHIKWYYSFPVVSDLSKWIINNKDNCGAIIIGEDYNTEQIGYPDEVGMYIRMDVEGFNYENQ